VIARDQVMALLLEACPSFAAYEPESLYIDLGGLAHHLVELQRAGRVDELPAVFAVVERLHVEGDDFVKEAATIGFLEGVQNVALNRGLDPDAFRPYLGPESKKAWDALNRFWSGPPKR
jgi:hypothetical protein